MKSLAFLFLSLGLTFAARAQTPFFPQLNLETQQWRFIDVSGNEALPLTLRGINGLRQFSDGLAAAQDSATSLWGFINASGKWQISPQYEQVQDFVDGHAIISNRCQTGCNQSLEGLLNDYISSIIDRNGKIVFTDHSQEAIPSQRFFLDQNLGAGFFRITLGYGYNDMKNIIDLKGNFLCETYSVFGNGGNIIYERELKAYKCVNRYYSVNGKLLLDLSSRYYFVEPFSNGYAWASLEEELDEVSSITWNVLVDRNGKEILKLDNAQFGAPKPVENGSFLFTDPQGETLEYLITENKAVAHEPAEWEQNTDYFIGEKWSNGCRPIYLFENKEEAVGFVNADGIVFYKIVQ